MTNTQALYAFLGAIALAMTLGQSAHLSPTDGIVAGFRILIQAIVTSVVGWIGDGSLWIFNTIWMMETLKNVLQAALFAGAALAGIFANDASEVQMMTNQATVVGFAVFGIMMALATRRVEYLRSVAAKPLND